MSGGDSDELLFVYNADSGLFNTLSDMAHKLFAPHTYDCDLCMLTHGVFKERETWRRFVEELGMPCRFLHRDQVSDEAGVEGQTFPAVFRRDRDGWRVCLSAQDIAACNDLSDLQQRLRAGCL